MTNRPGSAFYRALTLLVLGELQHAPGRTRKAYELIEAMHQTCSMQTRKCICRLELAADRLGYLPQRPQSRDLIG